MQKYVYPFDEFIQIPLGECRFFNLSGTKINENVRDSIKYKEYYRVYKLSNKPEYQINFCTVELGHESILTNDTIFPPN